MNIVFFSNPDFFGSDRRPKFSSMPRFTNMLVAGMTERGHNISVWAPESKFFNLPVKGAVKKWMGYIDQYILFPIQVRKQLKNCDQDTIFVFTDQAQGPWIPLVHKRNHVMHCHDFLAQWAAMGKIEGQGIGLTGKIYQRYIRTGYLKGKHFITSSNKTEQDLKLLMPNSKSNTYMIYLGLDDGYKPQNHKKVRNVISIKLGFDVSSGYLLHVGGNHWYKNREGVIEIYNAWRTKSQQKLPLLLIGPEPNESIQEIYNNSPFKADIHFVEGLEDSLVRLVYAGASLFLFPSYAEGFGWPSAEAMASGCPVITSNAAPMTEVVGSAGFLIPLRDPDNAQQWAANAAEVVENILTLPEDEKKEVINNSIANSKRFNFKSAMDGFEDIYKNIVNPSVAGYQSIN
ncbi:glycosyltransferase [Pedobacter mucosus]|uniref:glycosyltransferase n=1 Tax=Pedobacter mucosus TaxID=2895286 RepID=UPI001EE3DEDA|nr:glycosyltransferase [Pedobacter mucosus]UKT62240.1 glycosyltransferase [Pedobacter mucosus]